jgi:uncharacterized protein (DUF58 family)
VKIFLRTYIGALYLRPRLFYLLGAVAILHACAFFIPWLGRMPHLAMGVLMLLLALDYLLVFLRNGISASRKTPERLSNGDQNQLQVLTENRYPFPVVLEVMDELPFQFQERDFSFRFPLAAGQRKTHAYHLRPVKRGEYAFGALNIYACSPIGLVMRRYRFDMGKTVPVFPSFLQMRRYQLMAISNRLSEIGVKKIRRVGHSMEFEQIRDYVPGDDIRTINWKATARRDQMMVNSFTEEKSQQVYCVIDKGRVMKMPFDGLSLLDHSINASVVLSNVALLKQDKAGVITFSEEIGDFLPASGKVAQMNSILDLLHRQKTRYLESDFEKLYAHMKRRITQRSLIMLFTNFESLNALQRQLPYLRRIARNHLLMVVFFENSLLSEQIQIPALSLEDVYRRTIAAKFAFEKKQIVRELQQHGILTLLTAPEQLTVNAVNRYLELKSRQAI